MKIMVILDNCSCIILMSYIHVGTLSSSATQGCFSSLAPYGQADKGSSPALLISIIE
ncbi:MAG: hypothetical protein HRT53_02245 [Colwellia sp.]|nr:hypothetical protein [Colwellia sp.]